MLEVKASINPCLDKSLLVEIQPGLHDIAYLVDIVRDVALLELLKPLVVDILGR